VSGARARAASLALLAALAAATWIHRIEVDRHALRVREFEVDTYRYFWPTAVYLHAELSRGHLPLWNPHQLAGQPFLALHVPAVLYPPTLALLALLPPHAAFAVHSVLHLFLAGLFTWLFAGRLGIPPAGRLAAAAAGMLSGPLVVGFYMPPYLSAPAWLPAILWALHGLASEARARWAVALGAFLALAFLAGHAQAFVYEVQIAAVYGLFAWLRIAPRGRRARVAALAGLAGVLAAGLAAPQLLPALELAQGAVRGLGGVPFEQAILSSADLPLLLRNLLRGLAPEGLGGYERLLAVPVLALPLAGIAVLAPARRAHAWLFAALGLGVALVMLGPNTPFFALYYRLPLGNLFRGPTRISFAWSFCFAVLIGIGVGAVRELRAGGRAARAAAVLLAAAVAADAYGLTAIANAHPAVTGDYPGTSPEAIAFLRADPERSRVFVESYDVYSIGSLDKLGMLNGLYAVPDYEPSMPDVYRAYFRPRTRQPWHGRVHVVAGRDRARAAHRASPRLLDLMAVRHYLLETPAPPALVQGLREVTGSEGRPLGWATVFERAEAVPRAYAVRRVRYEPDFDAALRRLEEPGFRPREEAVLIGSAPAGVASAPAGVASAPPGAASAPPEAGAGAPDRVALAAHEAERVVVRAECGARCLLVLPDLHYPGWRARVDGRDAPVERANAIFRGVWLEPGAHEVVFRFEPASFRVGLALFAASLAALAAGAAWSARRTLYAPAARMARRRLYAPAARA
jgi:hypothetical protein